LGRLLFADRFTSLPETLTAPTTVYDERRGYTVTSDGSPFVETQPVASTHTMTKADAEPPDSDRAWDAVEDVGTRTAVRGDRDRS